MRPWLDFYDLAVPDVPGCPLAMLDSALREAAIAFCEQSLAWKYEHPDIAVVAATTEYPFVPPADAVVHAITYAQFADKEIKAHTSEQNLRIWDWRHQTGAPEYVLGGITGLTLVPTPDTAGTLKLTVALKPSKDAPGVDDGMFDEYRQAIVHGALARLMLSPKKPYTDAALGMAHQQQCAMQTGAAGTRAARNYTRAPLQTTLSQRR